MSVFFRFVFALVLDREDHKAVVLTALL